MKREDVFVIIGSLFTATGMLFSGVRLIKYLLLFIGVVFSVASFVMMMRNKKMDYKK